MSFDFIICDALFDKGDVLYVSAFGCSIQADNRLPLWSVVNSQCWDLVVNYSMSVNCCEFSPSDDDSNELVG